MTAPMELPPLRIHHFLIWMALTAAIISGCMTFDRIARNGPPIESRRVIAGLTLGAVTIAGAATVVGCSIFWRRRGILFPRSPGDCFIVAISMVALALCLAIVLLFITFFIFGDDDWFPLFYGVVSVVGLIVWVRLNWRAIKLHADTRSWRVAFWLFAFSPFLFGPGAAWILFDVAAVIASVVWAACADWRKGILRCWTHWWGIACVVSLGISLICTFGG